MLPNTFFTKFKPTESPTRKKDFYDTKRELSNGLH